MCARMLVQKLLANLTYCGFGVYMVHFFLSGPGVLLMRAIGVAWFVFMIPAAAVGGIYRIVVACQLDS